MPRYWILILVIIVAAFSYLLLRNVTESYRLLPLQNEVGEEWSEYTPPSGKFNVAFPQVPQHIQEEVKDPVTRQLKKYNAYLATKPDGTNFMVSITTYPSAIPSDEGEIVLRDIVDDMLKSNPTNTLKNLEFTTFQNRQAINFSLDNLTGSIDGKAFIDGADLYVISTITPSQNKDQQDYEYFINSFQLVPKPLVQKP